VRIQQTPLSRGMVPGTTLVLALVTIGIGIDLVRT
jgi:hypothetical protein